MPEFKQMYPALHTQLQAVFKKKDHDAVLTPEQEQTIFAAAQAKYTPQELSHLNRLQHLMPSGEQILAGMDHGIASPQATQSLDNFYGFVASLI